MPGDNSPFWAILEFTVSVFILIWVLRRFLDISKKKEKKEKSQLLISILQESKGQSVLVFSRTKHNADKIVKVLGKAGIGSQAIHGNKSQAARQLALNNFKSGKTRVMIATDIASRGIDISELPLVINYDLPDVPETYVHRIGRTGRAGNAGTALSFCSQEERKLINDIQKLTGKRLNRAEISLRKE